MSKTILRQVVILVLGTATLTGAEIGHAFDMGNMMNPSRWMGGNRDYGNYYGGPSSGSGYGYGVPAYSYGGPGYGYGSPRYGSSVPPYSYGVPAYGFGVPQAPGYPGYGLTVPAHNASQSQGGSETEIAQLKQRIKALEDAQSPAPMQPNVAPSYPAVGGGFYYRPTR